VLVWCGQMERGLLAEHEHEREGHGHGRGHGHQNLNMRGERQACDLMMMGYDSIGGEGGVRWVLVVGSIDSSVLVG
jgi:hypothetical protein